MYSTSGAVRSAVADQQIGSISEGIISNMVIHTQGLDDSTSTVVTKNSIRSTRIAKGSNTAGTQIGTTPLNQ